MCSLGIEPTTFALLTQSSTTEPQEHIYIHPFRYLSIHLSIHLNFHPSIQYFSIHSFKYIFIHQSIHFNFYPSSHHVYPHPSIHIYFHAFIYLAVHPSIHIYIWPWTTKPVVQGPVKSRGYICSNSQKYIVWVKIIYFSFMPKIIRILSKDHVPWRYFVNFQP